MNTRAAYARGHSGDLGVTKGSIFGSVNALLSPLFLPAPFRYKRDEIHFHSYRRIAHPFHSISTPLSISEPLSFTSISLLLASQSFLLYSYPPFISLPLFLLKRRELGSHVR